MFQRTAIAVILERKSAKYFLLDVADGNVAPLGGTNSSLNKLWIVSVAQIITLPYM